MESGCTWCLSRNKLYEKWVRPFCVKEFILNYLSRMGLMLILSSAMGIYTHDIVWGYSGFCDECDGCVGQRADDLVNQKASRMKCKKSTSVTGALSGMASGDNKRERQDGTKELVTTITKKNAKRSLRSILSSLFSRSEYRKK